MPNDELIAQTDWICYGHSAARAAGRPASALRPPGIRTIDVHAHVLVPAAAKYIREHAPGDEPSFGAADTQRLGKKQVAERATVMQMDLDLRLEAMDAMGVDVQLLTTPGQCYYTAPPDIALTASRMVNDGLAAFVARTPERFVALGTVPLQDAELAVKELERCMKELDLRGAILTPQVGGKELSDPSLEPFWRAVERLGAVILIHPKGFAHNRLARFHFNNVIGNPLDTTTALHYLIFDGVLERYPKLKIIAVHGGGFAGAYAGRMDHAWGARSDAHGSLPNAPSSYLRKIYVDTLVYTAHQLKYLAETFGVDHVLMGTDFPYDMGEYEPLEHVATVFPPDSPEFAAITSGNARELLRLRTTVPKE
jgi:aminocarboxymuconate-semialdehyde decarboxylase